MAKKYKYEMCIRWFLWKEKSDPREYVPHGKRWKAKAVVRQIHPITGRKLKRPEWWIREERVVEKKKRVDSNLTTVEDTDVELLSLCADALNSLLFSHSRLFAFKFGKTTLGELRDRLFKYRDKNRFG